MIQFWHGICICYYELTTHNGHNDMKIKIPGETIELIQPSETCENMEIIINFTNYDGIDVHQTINVDKTMTIYVIDGFVILEC